MTVNKRLAQKKTLNLNQNMGDSCGIFWGQVALSKVKT